MNANTESLQLNPIAAPVHPDPYPYYAGLVAERPFHRDDDHGFWVASSASAVTAVLTDPALRVRPAGDDVPAPIRGSAAGEIFGQLMRMTEGAAQQAIKSAALRAFESVVTGKVAGVASVADASSLNELTYQIPLRIMATFLGFEGALRDEVVEATRRFSAGVSPLAAAYEIAAGKDAATRLLTILEATECRGAVGDSFRAAARERGSSDKRITANTIGFLFQTCDATAGLIGNTLIALGRNPDVNAPLRSMVEETLRHDSPVQNTRRFAAAGTTIEGQQLSAGDTVLVILAAANRDPAANPDPHRFDPARPNARLFTFGAGSHACPGSLLATTMATAGVEALLAAGVEPPVLRFSYRPSVNTRVPRFE